MEINKTKNEEGNINLTLSGRLDTITSPKLQAALTEAIETSEQVQLDFAAVSYVSSAGLRVLLQGNKAAQGSGRSMALKNVLPEVREVFDMTGLTSILNIIGD
jgi:anti-anti-sigma factor